ncbi:MAG: hypothetical protein HOJ35_00760 [Bdellovibrionales bacterium]|nr:hypothetical protein [Bdellovibrionales bacterium]
MLDDILKKLAPLIDKLPPKLKALINKSTDEDDEDDDEEDYDDDKTAEIDITKTNLDIDDDDDDEEDEEDGEDDEDDDEEEGEEEEEEEDEKKVKRKAIIKKIVTYGLALYILAEFLFPEEEKKIKPKTAKGKNALIKKTATVKESKQIQVPPEIKKEIVKNDIEEDTVVNVEVRKPVKKIKKPIIVKKVPQVKKVKLKTVDLDLDLDMDFETKKVEPKKVIKTDARDKGFGSALEKVVEKVMEESVDTKVGPPDYRIFGRGLVYNCKYKFWACLDQTNYYKCQQNMKLNLKDGSEKECNIVAVYSSNQDCRVVQSHNVNTSVQTPFCK